jgi:hypothetical protein
VLPSISAANGDSAPFSVYFNAKNLTNTALKFTAGHRDNRVIQREFYGSYAAGGLQLQAVAGKA